MARTTTRCAVSLRDLFPRAQFTQPGDLRIDKCSADWRDCAPGDLFIAQTTADGDGHDEAEKALARGAIGVLGERLLPLTAPQVLVRDTRQAHGQLLQALAGHPSRQMRTIGVGGTAGKTVTTMLLAAILSDTVILSSPTTTERDHAVVAYLEELLGFDARAFGTEMFEASSAVGDVPAADIIRRDAKEYEVRNGRRFCVAQIETVGRGLLTRKGELLARGEEPLSVGEIAVLSGLAGRLRGLTPGGVRSLGSALAAQIAGRAHRATEEELVRLARALEALGTEVEGGAGRRAARQSLRRRDQRRTVCDRPFRNHVHRRRLRCHGRPQWRRKSGTGDHAG